MRNIWIQIKCVVVLILFSGSLMTRAQGSWEILTSPTAEFLHSVCFVDSLYGWAAGDAGIIIHTQDGGDSWEIQQTNTTYEVSDVFFLNRDLGWASAYNYVSPPYGTLLLKTTNGGVSWIGEEYPQENLFINTILFLDSLNGWMGAQPHALLHTLDGGGSWQLAAVDTSTLAFFPVLNIRFLNGEVGYASGGMHDIAGVIWQTHNGGQNWAAIDPMYAPADEIYGLHIFDSLHVLATGGDPDFTYGVSLLRTADGGMSWDYEEPGIQGSAVGLEFRTASEAWCPLGTVQQLIFSLDGGISWQTQDTPESAAVFDMTFPDSLHGFAVGLNGVVLKYTPPDPVSVSTNKKLRKVLSLHQNIPNPCSGHTLIAYEIPPGDFQGIELEVINSLGERVKRIQTENASSGRHEVNFDTSDWPPGLYVYQVRLQDLSGKVIQTEMKRMVVLR